MSYLSIKQTDAKWNIFARWTNDLCNDGRIAGAIKRGFYWAIPEEGEKAPDARVKTGRYIKAKSESIK